MTSSPMLEFIGKKITGISFKDGHIVIQLSDEDRIIVHSSAEIVFESHPSTKNAVISNDGICIITDIASINISVSNDTTESFIAVLDGQMMVARAEEWKE